MSDMAIGFSGLAAANDSDLYALLVSAVDGGGAPSLDQIISGCPRVLTAAWQSQSRVSDGALAALRAYRSGLDEGTRSWPWGAGPLEQLFEGLDRAFSLKAAQSLAASPLVTRSLSLPYLASACEHVYAALNSDDVYRARRLHEVLLAAVACDIADDPAHCRSVVWLTWLDVAKTVLGQIPDEALFTSASDIEANLLSLAESLDDTAMACDTRYRFAGVLTAPYIEGEAKQFEDQIKRWFMRGMDVGLPPSEGEVIPKAEDAFKLAEGRLRRALDDAVNGHLSAEGRIRALLATVVFRSHAIKEKVSPSPEIIASIADEAERALAALPSADLGVRLEMHMLLSALGRTSDTSDVEDVYREPVDDQIARHGLEEAYRIISMAVQVLTVYQPDLALTYLASLEGFQRRLPAHQRATFLRLHMRALWGGNTAEHARSLFAVLPSDQLVDGKRLLQVLEEQARRDGWTPAETLRCTLLVASPDVIVPEAVLPVLDWATASLAPVFVGQHRDAIGYLAAGRAADCAKTVYSLLVGEGEPESHGDPAAAVHYIVEALGRYCDLEMVDGALEGLEIVRNMVAFGGPGIAGLVISALSGYLGRLEALGGELALRAIAVFTSICVAHLLDEGDGAVLEALLLGKGHAFASAQAIGATFDVGRDDEAIDLLNRIREIETQLGSAADLDDGLDDRRLLVPYLAAQEERPEAGPVQMLRNLQHSFDEYVERKIMTAVLSGAAPAWRTWRWSVNGVVESLPGKTALMILYLSTESPPRLIAAIFTSEQVYLPYQQMLVPSASANEEGSVLGWVQMTTHYVRDIVQEDPGPRVVDREGGQILEQTFGSFLGPAVNVLADLRDRGYRHLIVVPDGPFHYFPIHLFGPPGKPLAADWLVTFQPSPLALVTADEQPRRRRAKKAVVLGIDFSDYPGGPARFEPLDGVAEEVRAVAAAVGGVRMLNEQVTKPAIAEALQTARWVHIATHGVANAYAPCFDAIAVWPDEGGADLLAAYELLGLDLRGLELVTLSACETALGRFDITDNLRGLTATLLRAGARAVIGTLWPVETDTSTNFFTALYTDLGVGATIGEAYSAAQHSTRQVHPQYRDWGAFVLMGSWTD
jgi:hypothetical protein